MYVVPVFDYPIPDYQLHVVSLRQSDSQVSSVSNSSPARPDLNLNNLQPGNVIVFENFEDYIGEVISYDVGEFLRFEGNDIINIRYCFKGRSASP
jgi:hypothetical protein